MFTTQFFVYSMQAFKSIFMSPICDRYLKEARKLSININVFLGKNFQIRLWLLQKSSMKSLEQ